MTASLILFLALATPPNLFNPKNEHQAHTISLFKDAKNFYNILKIETIHPLEQTKDAIFDNPFVIVMTDSGYFITDDQHTRIYKYFPDGTFDRIVAKKGDGPGEIQRVYFGTRIYDQKIAFWDSIKNSVYVYNQEGDFERELSLGQELRKHRTIPVGPAFAWPTKETFILSNALLLDQPKAQAISLNLEWDEEDNITKISIGHTLNFREVDHEHKFGAKSHTVLTQVGSRFWIGSPYFSNFTIFDTHKPQDSLVSQKILFPEALTPKDFKDVSFDDKKTRFRLNNLKGSGFNIIPFGSLVFVQVGALGFVPFDKNGHQIFEKRFASPLTGLRDTYKETAVFISSRKGLEKIERLLKINLLEESPHDTGDEDQPYIVLMRLREKFKQH